MTDNDQLAQQTFYALGKQIMADRNAKLNKCALEIIEECNQKIIWLNQEQARTPLGYSVNYQTILAEEISDYSILKQKLLEAIK